MREFTLMNGTFRGYDLQDTTLTSLLRAHLTYTFPDPRSSGYTINSSTLQWRNYSNFSKELDRKKRLKILLKLCKIFQRIGTLFRRLGRYKLVSGYYGYENVRFNERILTYVMYLNFNLVLHIVDEETRFSAARLLTDVSKNTLWRSIL